MKKIKAYINGKWIAGDINYPIYSPEGHEAGTAPALNKEDIDLAFESARSAQREWEAKTIDERVQFMLAFADKLDERADEMAHIMVDEIAKSFNDAKTEVVRTSKLVRDVVAEYLRIYQEEVTFPKLNKDVTIFRKALGVVLAISPFNYPINLSVAKIAPALVSGNTVVFKGATNGTLVGSVLAEIFDELKLPKGVFNFVTGRGREIGSSLYTNKNINAISFTGGERVGKEISDHASMAIQILELGGKDVGIVRADADLDLTASQIVKGGFSYSGQRCTAIKRVFVHSEVKNALLSKVVHQVNRLTVGKAADNNFITHVINKSSADYIMDLVNDAIDKGAKPLTEIKREGNLIWPIVLDKVTPDMRIAWEEQFGPVVPFIEVDSDDLAVELANKSDYGLQSSIFTKDIEKAVEMAHKMEVGSLNINGSSQRGPDTLPFTGVKNSGLNIQGIKYSLETMTRTFNIVVNK